MPKTREIVEAAAYEKGVSIAAYIDDLILQNAKDGMVGETPGKVTPFPPAQIAQPGTTYPKPKRKKSSG